MSSTVFGKIELLSLVDIVAVWKRIRGNFNSLAIANVALAIKSVHRNDYDDGDLNDDGDKSSDRKIQYPEEEQENLFVFSRCDSISNTYPIHSVDTDNKRLTYCDMSILISTKR